MSLLLSPEAVYHNDSKTNDPFLSEDENEDYNFKVNPPRRNSEVSNFPVHFLATVIRICVTYLVSRSLRPPSRWRKQNSVCSSLFKYVPANRFKYIMKDVRRQRCREEEESIWASFVKQQELNGYDRNYIQPSVQSIKQLLDEGMKEADKEIKKLEADILPDRIRKEYSKVGGEKKKKSKVSECQEWYREKIVDQIAKAHIIIGK